MATKAPSLQAVDVEMKPATADSSTDELAGYKEWTVTWLLRFLPRCALRGLQRLGYNKDTPLLKGALAPVDTEIFQERLQVVEGTLPKELDGVFVRTGPNDQYEPWGGYHLFDGLAMVHAVCFADGEAKSYSNHWLRCKRFLYEKAAGCNLFVRMALVWHNGKLLALMEGGLPFMLRLCSGAVRSIAECTFGGGLHHNTTAHPKIDPKSGELLSFACRQAKKLTEKGEKEAGVVYYTVSPSGHKGKNYPVDVQAGQLMHDFAVTENFAVFMDHALVFDGKTMITEKSLPFKTDTSRNSRLGLLRRSAPEEGVKWFEVGPFVGLHTATAFEEGPKVHVIMCRYKSMSLSGDFKPGSNPPAEPYRYTIDTTTGSVTETRLAGDLDMEFPVIPPHLVTLPAKYTYMAGNEVGTRRCGVLMDVLAKYDMTSDEDKGLVATIKLPEGYIGGEFIMVPRSAPSAASESDEDDGWLLGHVTDETTWKSFILVYDAKTMSNTPVAKVAMPQRVPLGFHGMFVHQEQLKLQQNVDEE